MLRLMLQILLLLSPLGAASATPIYPVSKPNCNDTCGNVTVPFPFGSGPGCFLDEWYEIVCINNTTPRLKKLDLEVLNVSMPQQFYSPNTTITVRYPIVHSNRSCSTYGEILYDPVNFTGSPFTFSSDKNIFLAVGCDNTAIMVSEEDPSFVGCKTKCTGNNTQQYSTCSGYDCCSSSIPGGLQAYNVDFQNNENSGGGDNNCQFAFLVNSSWFQSNLTDLYAVRNGDYVPVAMEWGVTNLTFVTSTLGLEIDPGSVAWFQPSACQSIRYINQSSGNSQLITCSCNSGFDGNAYLKDGCLDIDECELPRGRTCPHSCKNTPGYYECVRNRTPMFLTIGFSSGFGSLLLIFLSWWMYKVIKKRRQNKLKEKFFKRNGGLILQQQLTSPGSNVEKGKLFNTKELEKATDNFNID